MLVQCQHSIKPSNQTCTILTFQAARDAYPILNVSLQYLYTTISLFSMMHENILVHHSCFLWAQCFAKELWELQLS